jgi:hypothetical protein
MGTKATALGLYPTFLMKADVSLTISWNRSSLHYFKLVRKEWKQRTTKYLGRVHLVDGNDELTNTKGEGKEGMLSGLSIFGDTSFEFTSSASNDENGTVSLRGSGDHVFDEVTMTRGINDLKMAN